MLPFLVTPRMAGDPLVFEQDFNRGGCKTDINPLFGKLIGNAVIMSIGFDMIVDVDGGLLPFGIFIGMEGKWFHTRFVNGLKEDSPATAHLFKLAVIELDQLFRDGLVEFCQAEEGMVSQGG